MPSSMLTTTDSTVLVFDVDITGNDLYFNFVFASEEYNEFVNQGFNDVVGLFIDNQNYALVNGAGSPAVSIDTVNGGNPIGTSASNPQFYNNNDLDDGGRFLQEIGYDGFTTVLTAAATGIGAGSSHGQAVHC